METTTHPLSTSLAAELGREFLADTYPDILEWLRTEAARQGVPPGVVLTQVVAQAAHMQEVAR